MLLLLGVVPYFVLHLEHPSLLVGGIHGCEVRSCEVFAASYGWAGTALHEGLAAGPLRRMVSDSRLLPQFDAFSCTNLMPFWSVKRCLAS